MVKRVADLLKLFGEADGFKFLTHDFDPTRNDDFISLVNRCRILLVENTGLIPSHLYDLLFGFLYGKTWEDSNGTEHQFHCSSDECVQWCRSNPGIHPMNNPSFGSEFDAFRNSIRIYDRGLDKIIAQAAEKYSNLDIVWDRRQLRPVSIYTDVYRLKQIINKILETMSDPRFTGQVQVSFQKQDDVNGYHVGDLIIEQKGSFAGKSVQFVRDRVGKGAGDLGSLKNLMNGNVYWAIESLWEEGPVRVNLLKDSIFKSYFEEIDANAVTGFRHIIKFYHKTY